MRWRVFDISCLFHRFRVSILNHARNDFIQWVYYIFPLASCINIWSYGLIRGAIFSNGFILLLLGFVSRYLVTPEAIFLIGVIYLPLRFVYQYLVTSETIFSNGF